jgi:SAM-dependent methyltransferase
LTEYVIDHGWGAEARRLDLLGAWLDPWTVRHLEALDVGDGWQCLEAGAGSGSVARWLGHRVGPSGHVVAADIDTRFLERANEPNIEIRRHDLRCEDFAPASFDLVHTRFVLEHLPDRLSVMKRMVDWLKPGGWVLFEEPDCYAALASPNGVWARHMEAYRACCACVDLECGRALAAEVRGLGLVDLGSEVDVTVVRGGTGLATWYRLTATALRSLLLGTRLISDEELDGLCSSLDDPGFLEPGFTVVAVWARKPAAE